MKRWCLMLVPILLSGCFEDKKPESPQPIACFDIIDHHDDPPPSPILINKCTGETWIALYELATDADGKSKDRVYKWYRMRQTDQVNAAPMP